MNGTQIGRAALLVAACLSTVASAAPGDLDRSFGRDGVQITNFGWDEFNGGLGRAMVRQPDGKIVVAGRGADERAEAYALARFLPDGSVDPSFGDHGRVVMLVGEPPLLEGGLYAIARQPDGKLVATGPTQTPDFAIEAAVLRFHPDGTLDRGFGTDGIARVSLPEWAEPRAIAIQTDGKIVVAGSSGLPQPFVARLRLDGSVDAGFGSGGITTLPFEAAATAVAIQRDGRLLVAGYESTDSMNTFVARLSTDGVFDVDFGFVRGPTKSQANAVLEQSDGRVVVAGRTYGGSNSGMLFLRYEATGAPDVGFGANGVVSPSTGSPHGEATALLELADGKLLAAGLTTGGAAAVRLLADGSLDPEFGTGSVGVANDGDAYAIVEQADGHIVLAGQSDSKLMVAALDPDGVPDQTFGDGGTTRASVSSRYDTLNDLLVQHDGKLVAVGRTADDVVGDLAIARYLANGAPDTSFGSGGRVVLDLGDDTETAVGVVEQPGGKLVVGGWSGETSWVLLRFDSDGSLDPTFGTGGIVRITVPKWSNSERLLQQTDGKLVLAGDLESDVGLVRHHADGTLDTTFGAGGTLTVPGLGYVGSILQQNDGKLVVGGNDGPWWGTTFGAARHHANGTLDTSFDRDGRVFLHESSASWGMFRGLTQRADGRLLGVGGDALIRLSATGQRERLTLDPISNEAVLELPDGHILTAGGTSLPVYELQSDFALVRHAADGAIDTTFGDDGRVLTKVGGYHSWINTLRPYGTGTVVAAGVRGSDFAIARYVVGTCGNGVIVPDTECDDGDPCTRDVCTASGCVNTRAPRLQCASAGRSQLKMKNGPDDARDQLVWKWSRGDATSTAILGDPTDDTDYDVCLYTGDGASAFGVPAGTGWQRSGSQGYRFRSMPGSTSAATSVLVKSGTSGKAKAYVKAGGTALPDGLLPVASFPLTIQVVNDEGLCVGAVYEAAKRNDGQQLWAQTP